MTQYTLGPEQRRTKNRLIEQALRQSAGAEWEGAVATNRAILEIDPHDTSALNRLGRSLTKLGRLHEALETYRRAIHLDPANAIALRNHARLQAMLERLRSEAAQPAATQVGFADKYVMETGRSAVVGLENIAGPEVLATILPGDGLRLEPDGPYLRVVTDGGDQVGIVPPVRAQRVIELLAAGNEYSVLVVNANPDGVHVLISETYRNPSTRGKLPFPTVQRQSPETRAAMREIGAIPALEEEFVPEAEAALEDEDVEEAGETETTPLPDTEDLDEEEEEE